MDFYPAKNNDRLNRMTFQPEAIGGRVMVNPRYPVRELVKVAPWWCGRCATFHTFPRVRCDSGAFQDIGKQRFMPWTALEAQLRLEEQLRWWLGDETFHFEVIFIYDNPAGVDEAMIDGKKVKVRGTEETAAQAIEDTLFAAAYYATRRADIRGAIGWVGQGVDAWQYEDCVRRMLPLMRPGDVFAFGGFCIWGRMPKRMTPTARQTIARVLPIVRTRGITEFHMLGVMYAPAIEWIAAQLPKIDRMRFQPMRKATERPALRTHSHPRATFATDGSGPEQAACIGGRGYADGRQVDLGLKKEHKYKEYHPCTLAHQNISDYHRWVSSLS